MIAGVDIDTSMTDQPTIAEASFLQTVAAPNLGVRGRSSLLAQAFTSPERLAVGLDLYSAPDFENGLIFAVKTLR